MGIGGERLSVQWLELANTNALVRSILSGSVRFKQARVLPQKLPKGGKRASDSIKLAELCHRDPA